jgi:hypothetical protein
MVFLEEQSLKMSRMALVAMRSLYSQFFFLFFPGVFRLVEPPDVGRPPMVSRWENDLQMVWSFWLFGLPKNYVPHMWFSGFPIPGLGFGPRPSQEEEQMVVEALPLPKVLVEEVIDF